MSKKTQIKFGETIAILIIVYVVLMSGLIWYNKNSTTEINKMSKENQDEKAFEKYSYIESLDLLHVSQRGITDNEFDKNALIAFANYTKSTNGKEYIRKNLEESVVIIKLYNYTTLENFNSYLNITLYNNTPTDYAKNEERYHTAQYKTLIPVIDVIGRKTDIGIIEIKVYNKKR